MRSAVLLGESFRSEKSGDEFFLVVADEFDLALAVRFFLFRVGIGGGVEQNETLHRFRITVGEGKGRVTAHRMARDETARDVLPVEHALERVGDVFHRVDLSRDLRYAVARYVDR